MGTKYEASLLSEGVNYKDLWLNELRVDEFELTVSEVSSILCRCPELEVFYHADVPKALHKIYEDNWNSRPEFKLMNIKINFVFETDMILPESVVKEVVSLCPRLKVVELFLKETTPPDVLKPLLEVHEIHSLSVYNSFPVGLFFDHFFEEGIVPVLERHGTELKILNLEAMSDVDIDVIVYLCPNLEWLGLTENVYRPIRYNLPRERRVFEQLKFLLLTGTKFDEDRFPSTWYRTILSSKLLEEVLLCDVRIASEDVILVLHNHNFEHLKLLSICSCPSVLLEHVLFMLGLDNPLRYLGIIDCEQINKSNVDTIKHQIKDSNFDMITAVRPMSRFYQIAETVGWL